jgi:putative membrane protein
MWHAHDGMGWWMLFGGIIWLVFLATMVWLFLSVLSPRARPHEDQPSHHRPSDAREIARQRYARGEISREEFQQILLDLDNVGRGEPDRGSVSG